ncbi:MAG: site-specific integrase [Christensenellales bacterium]
MATAHKLPSGSWRVLTYTGTVGGKRQYKSFTAPTKKQAEYDAALSAVRRKRVSQAITVGEAVDRYIDSKAAVLSPATVMGYRSMRRNIFPALMKLRPADLTEQTVQQAVSDYAVKHKPKSVRNAYALLTSSCAMMMPEVELRATLPQKIKRPVIIPTDAQIKAMLDLAKGTLMYTVILMSAALGQRRSELCALEWTDIDFHAKTVTISKAMVPDEHFAWVIKAPKTPDSNRILNGVPDYLLDHLKALPRDSKYVISGITPAAISSRFEAIRDKLGLRCRLHDLRHYNASIMLALGVPDKYAQARMGHATPTMLRTVYQHLMDDKRTEVDASIATRLSDIFR